MAEGLLEAGPPENGSREVEGITAEGPLEVGPPENGSREDEGGTIIALESAITFRQLPLEIYD